MSEWKYGHKLGFGHKAALLVSDMQQAYTQGHYNSDFTLESEIEVINELISLWRKKNLPIFFTVIAFTEQDISHPNMWLQKIPELADLRVDSELTHIDKRLSYQANHDGLIIKQNTSAFHDTALADNLHIQGIDTLVITGCTTSGCVRASTVDALQHNFRPIVIQNAVADRRPDAHKQALHEIGAKYADVVDSNYCLSHIQAT